MCTRSHFTIASLVIIMIAGAESGISAQQQGSGLVLPIAGVADLGATFSGTLRIRSFSVQGNTVAATGVVSGVLNDAAGTARNLVTRMSVPVDLTASLARRNTDVTLALAPCDVLHLEFGAVAIQMLGSTLTLDPSALDITAAEQSGTTAASQGARTTAGPQPSQQRAPVSSFDGRFPTGTTSVPTGMTTPIAGTSIVGSAVPGIVTSFGSQTAATPTATVASQVNQPADLGPLLCSASRLRDSASERAQLVQVLNRVIATIE
jgi:hypothetical protein